MDRDEILNQALEAALLYQRAGIELATGTGKTKLGSLYCKRVEASKILVVAPKLSIFQSWRDEAVKWGFEDVLGKMTFSTYLSLGQQPLDYDLVILDECHSITVSCQSWLSQFKGRILGLSGTFPKYHHSEKGILIDAFCPKVFSYGADQAIEHEILNDYRIVVHPLELSTKNDFWVKTRGGGFNSSEQKNYQYWTQRIMDSRSKKEDQITRVMRMKALQSYKTKEYYAKKLFNSYSDKCICFADSQDAASKICHHSYHSNNPDSEKNLELFKEGKILKLSAVNQLSEGVNIPGLKRAIVMSSYSAGSPRTSQKLGRILRLSPNETAIMDVLVYSGTQDEVWLRGVLNDYSPEKIVWKDQELIKI